jgi:hypothetical protein
MKSDGKPKQRAHDAPRCTAHSKRTGLLCKTPAVRVWNVCRTHAEGGGAPDGADHPNFRQGLRTNQMEDVRRLVSLLSRAAGDVIEEWGLRAAFVLVD